MQPQVLYLLLVVLAVGLLAAISLYAWQFRRAPGIRRFLLMSASSGAWAALVGAMALSPPHIARALLSVKYAAIGAASLGLFLFVAGRAGRVARLPAWKLAAFSAIPVMGAVASWRDGDGMVAAVVMAQEHGLTHVAAITFGPLYWVFTGYLYILAIATVSLLLVARNAGWALPGRQATPLIAGVVAPLATNVLLITGVTPRAFDPMPFGLAVSGAALWWSAFRARLLDLVPVARHVLVDSLAEAIAIVDEGGRILDVNRRFAALLHITPAALAGRPMEAVDWPSAVAARSVRDALSTTPASHAASAPRPPLPLDGRQFDLEVIDVPGESSTAARVLVLHDVTDRQRWQDEQTRLIDELRQALGQVKTLSGLLPICAGCKQIRDEGGRWHALEVYIRDRTDAEFSHGLCPGCVARLYPELQEPASH